MIVHLKALVDEEFADALYRGLNELIPDRVDFNAGDLDWKGALSVADTVRVNVVSVESLALPENADPQYYTAVVTSDSSGFTIRSNTPLELTVKVKSFERVVANVYTIVEYLERRG